MYDVQQPGYPYAGWSLAELRYWAAASSSVVREMQARLAETVEAAAGSVADAVVSGKKAKAPKALRRWLKALRGSDG
jgi:hypothetical protein